MRISGTRECALAIDRGVQSPYSLLPLRMRGADPFCNVPQYEASPPYRLRMPEEQQAGLCRAVRLKSPLPTDGVSRVYHIGIGPFSAGDLKFRRQ